MSDTVYNIFPRYYFPKYTEEQVHSAVRILKMYSDEEITFTNLYHALLNCMKWASASEMFIFSELFQRIFDAET